MGSGRLVSHFTAHQAQTIALGLYRAREESATDEQRLAIDRAADLIVAEIMEVDRSFDSDRFIEMVCNPPLFKVERWTR